MDDSDKLTLVKSKHQCLLCGDIISSKGEMVFCKCGELGVDSGMGEFGLLRISGNHINYKSLCIWQSNSGEMIYDEYHD